MGTHHRLILALLLGVAAGGARAGALSADEVVADEAAAIRARLERWTEDFNAGRKAAACDLFSAELVSDFKGQGEADHATRCAIIERAIDDPARDFRYALELKEIIVEGDLAIARLTWTLSVSPGDITSVEPGLDVFRKEADGQWRIIRYMAYDED